MVVDFGVQIACPFDRQGNVRCVETPSGEVASISDLLRCGAYALLSLADVEKSSSRLQLSGASA